MKKAIYLAIIGLLLPLFFYGQSIEGQDSQLEKIYIDPSQLAFTNREMFVHIEGQWTSVSAVHCDALGLYIAAIRTRWICPVCLYNNSEYAKTCQRVNPDTGEKCGHPRPH